MYRIRETEHIDPVAGVNIHFVDSIRRAAPAHCHDFWEFFFITRGNCLHRVNGRVQRLRENMAVCIRPDDVHSYAADGPGDCQFFNLACTGQVMRDLFAFLGRAEISRIFPAGELPPVALLPPDAREVFLHDCDRLRLLVTIDRGQANTQLRRLLVWLTGCFTPTAAGESPSALPLWLESLLTQMQRRENFAAGRPRLMELAGRSEGHVSRAFRQHIDMTPTEYVNSLRLEYVRSTLRMTDADITDTAMEAGFDNLSHFYHLFRRRFGTTPASLRSGGHA